MKLNGFKNLILLSNLKLFEAILFFVLGCVETIIGKSNSAADVV